MCIHISRYLTSIYKLPNTINEMLCMSHVPVGSAHIQGAKQPKKLQRPESEIRMFPVWPKNKDARFENIRCWGAFLVSSELNQGKVQYVKIHSERGRDCKIINPWPGKNVKLCRNGHTEQNLNGDRFCFETEIDETIMLVQEEIL